MKKAQQYAYLLRTFDSLIRQDKIHGIAHRGLAFYIPPEIRTCTIDAYENGLYTNPSIE